MSTDGSDGMGLAELAGAAHGVSSLASVDWDFAGSATNALTHGLHPYPAKFIPQIPDALISALSHPGDVVGDIFCGSGTTLVEALRLGRNAVGVDANPLACLITEAKTKLLLERGVAELRSLVVRARAKAAELSGKLPMFATDFRSAAVRPESERLHFWFEPHVIEELAEILDWSNRLGEDERVVALASFSAIVVAVSKQDSDTRYVRRAKQIAPGDTFKRFAKTLESNIAAVDALRRVVPADASAKVLHASVLDRPSVDVLDLVVCSPPYPNAYSYHLYHMTRMMWLGMDQPTFKSVEIGSHRKYSRKGPTAADANTFRREFEAIFDWLRNVLRIGRYACFVVGNSILRSVQIDNAEIISKAGADYGFVERARFGRRMQDTKKAFNPSIGKIKTEKILILENTGGGR